MLGDLKIVVACAEEFKGLVRELIDSVNENTATQRDLLEEIRSAGAPVHS